MDVYYAADSHSMNETAFWTKTTFPLLYLSCLSLMLTLFITLFMNNCAYHWLWSSNTQVSHFILKYLLSSTNLVQKGKKLIVWASGLKQIRKISFCVIHLCWLGFKNTRTDPVNVAWHCFGPSWSSSGPMGPWSGSSGNKLILIPDLFCLRVKKSQRIHNLYIFQVRTYKFIFTFKNLNRTNASFTQHKYCIRLTVNITVFVYCRISAFVSSLGKLVSVSLISPSVLCHTIFQFRQNSLSLTVHQCSFICKCGSKQIISLQRRNTKKQSKKNLIIKIDTKHLNLSNASLYFRSLNIHIQITTIWQIVVLWHQTTAKL